MSLVLGIILNAVIAQTTEVSTWPLAEIAVAKHCPDAESEEIVRCTSELMENADQRIKRDLCRTQKRSCQAPYLEFAKKRRSRIDRTIDREGSVVSQLFAMWNALEESLRFERSLKTRRTK